MTRPVRLWVLLALIAVWLYGAWLTRSTDSDTGRPTSSPTVTTGKTSTVGDTPSTVAAGTPTPFPAATRASRNHRRLPKVLLRIRECESHGNYRAENRHSSASGAWQITTSTWNGHRGYSRASAAPRWVQDEKALLLYLDRGTQPWHASRGCWS